MHLHRVEEAVGWRDSKLRSLFKLRFHCACTQRNKFTVQWFWLYASLRCLKWNLQLWNIKHTLLKQHMPANKIKLSQKCPTVLFVSPQSSPFHLIFNFILPCLSFDQPPSLYLFYTYFPSSSFKHVLCLLAVTMFVLKIFLSAAQTLLIYFPAAVIQPDSLQNSHKRCKDPGAGQNE